MHAYSYIHLHLSLSLSLSLSRYVMEVYYIGDMHIYASIG